MVDFFRGVFDRAYNSYVDGVAQYEQRVADGVQPPQPFMGPEHAYSATIFYLLAVALLSSWMRGRAAPFKLKGILLVYNFVCVLLAGAVCVIVIMDWPSKFICNSADFSESGLRRAFGMWLYYIQKYFEYFDTFFFILRQSWRQVTFLHIYHHASVSLVVRQFLMYDINGDSYVASFSNSLIHVLMYSHYFLSALGVKTWWRPYLTQMQLLQFAIIFVHTLVSYIIGPDCGSNDYLKTLQLFYMGSMLTLFYQFYRNAYAAEKKEKGKDGEKKDN